MALEDGKLVFDVLDRRVTQHGLARIPLSVDYTPDSLSALLSAAAHYYWYLNRTKGRRQIANRVEIEFMEVERVINWIRDTVQVVRRPCGGDLTGNDGVIRVAPVAPTA